MGAQRQRRRMGRTGRHRRGRDVLLEHHDSDVVQPQRTWSIPAPTPSALVGVAVLVLIGGGVIHLSGSGSAVPLDEATAPAAHSSAPIGDTEPAAASEADDAVASAPALASKEAAAPVIVHVSGAVEQPGLVELPAGARIDDAVSAAGGAAADADLAAVNLARPLVDGEQIHIPRPGETPLPATETGPGSATGSGDERSDLGGSGTGQVNLNTADATGLEQLPGVGPAIAQRIIEHREKNGAFRSVDDLIEVSGIGPATLEKIRDQATV